MNNKQKFTKYTSGLTALALTFSLTTSGCDYGHKFTYTPNENGELVVAADSHINYKSLENYYVVEVYSKITESYNIYIARKYESSSIVHRYYNIFNNYFITTTDSDEVDNIIFIKATPLTDYLISYDIVKANYSYEDMQSIYETIQENYKYTEDKPTTRKLIPNNNI